MHFRLSNNNLSRSALLCGRLYLLTWRAGVVLEYDWGSLQLVQRHASPLPEGWGLTTDGCDLIATSGEALIYRISVTNEEAQLVVKAKVPVCRLSR